MPCLRGDIALALLSQAMLFAFWGVWALTGQSHKAWARIAGPFQTPYPMHVSGKGSHPLSGESSHYRHACMCWVARLIALVVLREFLCKAGCLIFMVHELWLPYDEAVRYVDRHPCNKMRELNEWGWVCTWLLETESSRRVMRLREEDSLPTMLFVPHIIPKMWRGVRTALH